MADVQAVTTRSKKQCTQWEIQDEVRQAAKEWIDTANQKNAERMQQDMRNVPGETSQPSVAPTSAEDEQLWDVLTNSRISLPLHKLLPLMPRFRDTLAALQANTTAATPAVHLTEPGTGPPLMDSQNPAVRIIIKGQELHGCIIDGGSGVNVISETTCHNLGLYQWEPCPFWLRMADTRSVRPIGLIRHLEVPPPRAYVHNFGRSTPLGGTRRIPDVARASMATNREY